MLLRNLSIEGIELESIEPISELTSLEKLILSDVVNFESKLNLEPIGKLENLEYLCLENVKLESVEPLRGLERMDFVVASIVFLLLIGYTLNKVGENGSLLIEELTGEKDNVRVQITDTREGVGGKSSIVQTLEGLEVENVQIPKNWTKQTKTFSDSELNDTQISQYTDEEGNVVGYEVVQGENKFAYSLEHAEYQFKEVQGESPRYHWNNDEEFLYEAVLSEEEKTEISTTVRLVEQVDVEDYTKYKDFLNFGGEAEWALPRAYSIINDGMKMSFILYERHRSVLDESFNHTAATGQFLICLKEKVIIKE